MNTRGMGSPSTVVVIVLPLGRVEPMSKLASAGTSWSSTSVMVRPVWGAVARDPAVFTVVHLRSGAPFGVGPGRAVEAPASPSLATSPADGTVSTA